MDSEKTLVDVLCQRTADAGTSVAFTRFADLPRDERQLTYSSLDRRARAVAAALQAHGLADERILLLLAPGLEYIAAFFGCLYAGAVAVPSYPPSGAAADATDPANRHSRGLTKIRSIALAARPRAVLTQAALLDRVAPFTSTDEGIRSFTVEQLARDGQDLPWVRGDLGPESLAYLQFTSGSTGSPRGVMVTHANLLTNLRDIQTTFRLGPESVVASWLPPYHDMGLIGGILEPIYCGGRGVQLSPAEFLQRPSRWLEAIHRHHADTSGAPNFAYDLCARRVAPDQRAGLDLSRWTLAFSGAEPIRADTLDRFVDAFGPCGFDRRAMFPCYGLAEATLAVTTSRRLVGPRVMSIDADALGRHRVVTRDGDGKPVVGCGTAVDRVRVVIVDAAQNVPCADGQVGEIWVQGASVAAGYWDAPEATARTFGARLPGEPYPFLRTGDLGFLDARGELYVVGRSRDLIIVRGTNHYPTDIEATVETSHLVIRSGGCAAFGVPTPDGERVAIVAELDPRSGAKRDGRHEPAALNAIVATIRGAVLEAHDLEPAVVVLVAAGTVPKTSSGKTERYACRERLLAHALPFIHEWRAGGPARTSSTARRTPQTAAELTLAGIWSSVLDSSEPGLDDDFFEAGGHSLMAMELIERIRSEMRIELPMRALIEHSTLEALARHLGECPATSPVTPPESTRDQTPFEPFPLTEVQEAYLFGRSTSFELGGVATQGIAEFDAGAIDVLRLARAVNRLVQRHEMLRAIVRVDGTQQVLPEVPPFEIEVHELSAAPSEERQRTLQAIRTQLKESMRPADRWPLFDIVVCSLDGGTSRVFARFDLLIADLHSLRQLWRELGELYADPDANIAAPALSFRECLQRQSANPTDGRSERYWRERLSSLPDAPALPYVQPFAALGIPRFTRRTLVLDAAHWERLQALSKHARVTPSAVLLAAFAEVIAAWSRAPRFALTLTFFNRPPLPGVDRVVGDFTSLLLVGIEAGASGFAASARAVQQELWSALEHRHAGGVRSIRELGRLRGRTGHAIAPIVFTSALGQERDQRTAPWAWLGHLADGASSTPQVVLDHQAQEDGDRLLLTWDSVDALFPAGTVDEMFAAYQRLLDWLVRSDDWSRPTPALTPDHQVANVARINQTDRPLAPATLHGLFLKQAGSRPDHPAVITAAGVTLTYADLERRSRAVAQWIAAHDTNPDQLVAIVMRKGWEQVVAALGVVRAGRAYLPIDPALPLERRQHLFERGQTRLALTQTAVDASLEWPVGVIRHEVDAVDSEGGARTRGSQEVAAIDPHDWTRTAYVIFTSGSTGEPKGVTIDHRGAVNTILDLNARFAISPGDRILGVSGLGFDLSVYDVFGTLAAGGTLVLPGAGTERNPDHWADLVARHHVTLWNSVPALFEMLCEHVAGASATLPGSLRLAWLSGDWIPLALPDRARALRPGLDVVSMGGATEASIWSVIYPIGEVDPRWRSIPYGRPMVNQQMYVLDEAMRPRPDWVAGDLYIGGLGVALGYWRDPLRTNASFVTHPSSGERLYRTGDVARWTSRGTLEFLGREDGQVKLGGLRIELGEIEAALNAHPDVRAAVVLARHVDGTAPSDASAASKRQLVAYVVPAEGRTVSDDGLRVWAGQKVSASLVPRRFIQLDALPLSANGKVDVAKLPAIAVATTAPAVLGPEETAVREIWAEALNLAATVIGPVDNFFDVGGTSIALVRVAGAVSQRAGRSIPLLSFFEHPTVSGMARLAHGGSSAPDPVRPNVADRAALRKQRLARRETVSRRSGDGA